MGIFVLIQLKFYIIISLILSSILTLGQNTDEKLAAQFYEAGDFEKAVVIYKKIYKNAPASMYIYENYLNCLVSLDEEQAAAKLVQKQIKKYPGKYYYVVDLGFVYSQFGHEEKANQYFERIINDNTKHKELVNMLAQAFIKRDLNEMAVLTFEKATNRHGLLSFSSQLMSLYRMSNNTKDLINLALEVIGKDKNKYDEVMRKLDIAYNKKESAEYLQQRTLNYIQKHPNKIIYEELLLEIYLQQKKYNAALRQVISIDKRNNEKGLRVKALSDICVQNEAYEAAIKGYQYVINLEPQSMYYLEAEKGLINSLYLKTTSEFQPQKEEVKLLISHINNFLNTNGRSYQTVAGMYQLAELQIFYNDNVDEGVRILEEVIQTPRIRATFLAKSKILLGDAYLMKNEIWDAKLMYGQVDKDFKEDALGQEAKFKSAKLSYYTGDFDWAKSQLEILKTATSQLISNNALELSLLIQDNVGLDSTEDAMKEYAMAEFYLVQNKINKCEEILNILPFTYPNHTLNDEIYFLKAKVKEKQGNFVEANNLYEKIYTNYGDDILADNALYRSANIYLHLLDNPQKAESLFEKILLEYSSSLYAVDARKLYYGLKDGKSKKELFFEGL